MFRVIVLHKTMTQWHLLRNEGYQCLTKYVCIQRSVHPSFEYANSSSPTVAYTAPDVHLHRMLRSVYSKRLHQRYEIIIVVTDCLD